MLYILLLSILIICSSEEWLIIWVGFELNSLSFLVFANSIFYAEFEFKYYFFQFIGSILFLMSVIFNNSLYFLFSISIKALFIPFVYWLLAMFKWLSKKIIMIYFFLQKMGLFLLMCNMIFYDFIFLMFLLMNFLFSMMNGLLSKHNVDYFLFSSINQSSLMTISMMFTKTFFVMFLFVYMVLASLSFKMLFTSEMGWNNFLLFLILSGFPPLLIFFIKMYFLSLILYFNSILFLLMIMLIFSGMSYMYMKMFILFLINTKMKKLMSQNFLFSNMWFFFFIVGIFFIG